MVRSNRSTSSPRPTRPNVVGWVFRIAALVFVLGMLPRPAAAQTPAEFEVPITVTDGAYTTTLTIGMRDGARSGRDEYDRAAPPPPPAGAFDARLIGPDEAYFTDVRPSTTDSVSYEIVYQASNEAGPITLSWSPNDLIDHGSFVIVDRLETGTVSVDMTETDQLDTSTEAVWRDGLIIRVKPLPTPLPVELSSFVGRQLDNGAVRLQWRTQSETNNAGFAIEQRRGGEAFREIGFVQGAGTTAQPQDYQYRVDDVHPGSYAFRLRQVDQDGSVAYSETVPVQVSVKNAVWMRGPTPNPVRNRARLALAVETPQQVVVETFDLLGRRVHRVVQTLPAHQRVFLGLSAEQLQLPSGQYFVHVRGETFTETRRMTVLR